MTAAVSLAACTCALGLPVDVFAQTAAAPSSHAEKSAQTPTPAPSAAPAPATKHSIAPATDRSANDANTKVYDTAANYTITNQDDNSITFSYVKNKNKISNPFPDVISDEEIEAAFKKGDVCIKKALFLPNPTPDNPNPRPIYSKAWADRLPEGKGTFKQYAVFRFADYAYPIQLFAWCAYQSRNGTIASDGSIYVGSSSTVNYALHPGTFKLNGYTLPNNSKTRILIDVDRNNAPDNYFYYELTCPTDNNVNERVLMNGGVAMTTGGYGRTSLVREFDVAADAEFHFVDDLQYHALHPEGINTDGTLKQRGNSDNHASLTEEEKKKGSLMSAKPFYEIKDLQDINGAPALSLIHI